MGHVYISVGIKDMYGPQDLDNPNGKIHRIKDDGRIPPDNPYVVSVNASSEEISFTRQTTWTYGHRSPQGLEWNYLRGRMWDAEMGPRGGDEINELLPGKNYGWPYHSLGLEYTGQKVERHKPKDIEFDISTVEQTLVDITPSPAISSFAFYDGVKFERWKDNLLLGSLKGSSLYRLVFDGNKLIHKETLIKDLARIRDVEVGYDGLVYLLLENKAGSKIVRLVPVGEQRTAIRH
jgi:glucose/arabinose dehydrogenase